MDERRHVATSSSLRNELDSTNVYVALAGVGMTILFAGLLAAIVGPLGLVALLLVAVQVSAAWWLLRGRTASRERVRTLAASGTRALAVTIDAQPLTGRRGRVLLHRVTARMGEREVEAAVYWNARPHEACLCVHDGDRALLYFASGPLTQRELERAFDIETGQFSREPTLPDEPLPGPG